MKNKLRLIVNNRFYKKEKFYVLDKNGRVVKKSENLDSLINRVEWTKLKVVR